MNYLKNSSSEVIFPFPILLHFPKMAKVNHNISQNTILLLLYFCSTSTLLLLYFYSTPEQSISTLLLNYSSSFETTLLLLEQFARKRGLLYFYSSSFETTLLLLEQFRKLLCLTLGVYLSLEICRFYLDFDHSLRQGLRSINAINLKFTKSV